MKIFKLILPVMALFLLITLIAPAYATAPDKSLPSDGSDVHADAALFTEFNDLGIAGIEIDYSPPQPEISSIDVDDTIYQYVNIDGFGKLNKLGMPALPMRNFNVAVPIGGNILIEILESDTEVLGGYRIHPALEPALDSVGAPEPEFVIDDEFYELDQNYPAEPVRVSTVNKLRGISLAQVQVCPVQHNPAREELTIYSRLKFRITFVEGTALDPAGNSAHFYQLLRNSVINHEIIPEVEVSHQDATDDGRSDIIIITHSDYLQAAVNLSEWKRQMGYDVEIISQSSWTSNQVKDVIHDRYGAWTPKPDYFVIIGDHDDVPAEDIGSHVTDLYYACMDGPSDYYPDMAYGRISVSSEEEANTVINKIVGYERNPVSDADFYNHGINAAYFQDLDRDTYADRRFAQTSWEIRQHLINNYGYQMDREFYAHYPDEVLYWNNGFYSNGEEVSDYLRYPNYVWDGNAANIRTEIDAGRFLVTHRDHGGVTLWGDPYFTISDINALSNGDKLPVVFSVNCLTGKFDLDSFAEAFLRHPTGGAVGVFAATEVSYSGYNDGLAEGFIDAIWPELIPTFPHNPSPTVTPNDPMYTMGSVLNQGKIRMEETWGSNQYTFEIFHYLGDPSMKIWTAVPQTITATHDSNMIFGQPTFNISDAACQTGTATLYYNGEIIGKGSLSSGDCNIPLSPYTPSPPATALLTITSHNYRPYQATIDIEIAGAHVTYNAHQVNDAAGNNNGLVDSGESILLGMTLENVGTSGAADVSAVLSTSDPYITITDDTQSWGTISANSTSTQNDAFEFDVAGNIPDQHEIDFLITATGIEESTPPWYSIFSTTVNAPKLTVGSMTINDSGGNGNGILDPGETVDILVQTSNLGHANATSTTATLSSPSSYITVNTPSHNFGTVAAGGSDIASFSVSANSTTPLGTAVDFEYEVSSGAYYASDSFAQHIGCAVAQVGYGTTPIEFPLYTHFMDSRTQSILLADDIQFSGPIYKIKLYCSTRPSQVLEDFYIRMQHTTMDTFTSESFVNTGWSTVLHAIDVDTSSWDIPGWVEFQLTTPFEYNGTDNLLIDYCLDNSTYTYPSAECYSTGASDRTLIYYNDLPSGNVLNVGVGVLQDWYNNVVLSGCPIPSLIAPHDGAVHKMGEVIFQWNDLPTADDYTIQIDIVNTFDSPDLIEQTLANTEFTASLTKGIYYWHVSATLGEAQSTAYSPTWRVTIVEPVVRVTTDPDSDYNPSITQTNDGKIWIVWQSYRSGGNGIWYKTSSDSGATWSEASPVDTGIWGYQPTITQTNDGNVTVAFYSHDSGNSDIWYTTSSNGGTTWSEASQVTTDSNSDYEPAIIQAKATDEKIWVVWRSYRSGNSDIWYKTSSDDGTTWSAASQVTTDTSSDYAPAITQTNDGKIWIVWQSYRSGGNGIWYKTSSDDGATWSAASPIDSGIWSYDPAIAQTNDGNVYVAFHSYESGNRDIWYTTSSDGGGTWSEAYQFTRFVGYDYYPALAALSSGELALAWYSDRYNNYDIWYGIPGSMEDINPPPYLYWAEHEPWGPSTEQTVTVRASAIDESGIDNVQLVWWIESGPQANLAMYDDGSHGDWGAGDGVYGVEIGPFPLIGTKVEYQIQITDIDGNTVIAPQYRYSFEVVSPFTKTADILLVSDGWDGYTHYYTDALDNAGYAYDVWETNSRGNIAGETLNQYLDGILIWAVPEYGYSDWGETMDNLTAYLENGGRLFISGQNIGNRIGGSSFYQNYLHAQYVQNNTGLYALLGVPDDPITDGLYVDISGDYGANNQYSPDEIDPISPAEAIFTYDPEATAPLSVLQEPHQMTIPGDAQSPLDGPNRETELGTTIIESSGSGALRVDTGTYKVVYFAFGFEAINYVEQRALVMDRVLSWLQGQLWSVPMTVSTPSEASNPNLEFGTHYDATDGFDSGIDIPHPPQGPGATLDAYFSIVDPLFPQLDEDYRAPATSIQWTLQAGSTTGNITITWDASGIPSGVSAYMQTATEIINMKQENVTVLPQGEHTITIITGVELEITLKAGWNMVSVPAILQDPSVDAVFPGNFGVFTWNSSAESYYSVEEIEPCRGYWVAMAEDSVIPVSGPPVCDCTISIFAGWNMIGSVCENADFTDPCDDPDGCVLPFAYWWEPVESYYVYTQTIEPTKGYWVAAICNSSLTLPTCTPEAIP